MLTANTLTLDLGTKTGYAVGIQGAQARSLMPTAVAGTWELLTEKEAKEQRRNGLERLGDARYYRLRNLVLDLCVAHKVARIVFEDVQFSKSVLQTQVWVSLRTALWEVSERLGLELKAVPVPTLKAFACANPHADKTEMASALRNREPETEGKSCMGDDNEIDARWLLFYTLAVDEGERNWSFGWQLKEERRIETQAKRARRRLEQKERLAAVRADGLIRLDTLVRALGERMAPRAAQRAVVELCRSTTHTLKLNSHLIVGTVLKSGELRWKLSQGGLPSGNGTSLERTELATRSESKC